MIKEAHPIIDAAADYDSLAQLQAPKVIAVQQKIQKKVDTDIAVKTLLAPNSAPKVNVSEPPEDLQDRGRKVLGASMKATERLGMLANILTSLNCDDEAELEYSPTFLHRAYVDAVNADVAVSARVLILAISRSAVTSLSDGNISQAVGCLDEKMGVALGVGLVKGNQLVDSQLAQCQIGADILVECVELLDSKKLEKADVLSALSSMRGSCQGSDIKEAIASVEATLDTTSLGDAEWQNTLQCLSVNCPTCPEPLARCFSFGIGRNLLQEARKARAQMLVESGPTPRRFNQWPLWLTFACFFV